MLTVKKKEKKKTVGVLFEQKIFKIGDHEIRADLPPVIWKSEP